MPTKGLGPHWFGAMTLVFIMVIASALLMVVTVAGPLPRIAVGIDGVARVTVVAEMFMHRDRGARPAASLCLVD